jgi:SAM-dependent MidA family methyltransferase
MSRIQTTLGRLLKERIKANGRITFCEFMHEALFHEALGFYSKGPGIGSQSGTFNTSAMYPVFAWCLAQAVEQAEKRLGQPLRIVEFGAGTGELGARIVSYLNCPHEYVVVETSSGLRQKQEARGLKVVTDVEELASAPSFVFANEVVDALPVNRVMGDGQGNLLEMYVALDQDGDFIEEFDEPSTSGLASRLRAESIHLGRGHLAEICLDIYPFIQKAASIMSLGYLMIIDYGYDGPALYSCLRKNGGLRCYFRQQQVYDPFDNIGDQDITTDVDFTALKSAAEKAGLLSSGRAWQGNWLKNLDIHKFQSHDMTHDVMMGQIKQLTHAARLGNAFSVLAWKYPDIPDAPGFSSRI